MDRTSSAFARARKALAALFGLLYLISVGWFWVAGFLAYFRHFSGPARLAGLLFFPTLALPFVGKGTIGGLPVDSFFWWGWFALHLLLAGAVMLVYPSRVNSERDRTAPPADRPPAPASDPDSPGRPEALT